jgi:hypothetical protein
MPRDPDDATAPAVTEIPGPRPPTDTAGDETGPVAEAPRRPAKATLELVAIVLLSVTTILTAWTAFQASKWGGAMSIAFSEASSSRIEAARADGAGNVRTSNHIGLWTQWAAAVGAGEPDLADFVAERFPEPLATAHQDWLAAGGTAEGAPDSPFDMPSYVLPEKVAAAAADARADVRFASALTNNQRSDNYTILTVLFAAVLFFSAMSSRASDYRSQRALLVIGMLLGVVGIGLLLSFPKLI